jgi:hypothetical protein
MHRLRDDTRAPSARGRALAALGVAAIAGSAAWIASHRPGFSVPDFHTWWTAARALLDGQNPYAAVAREVGPGFAFFSPLPAALFALPLAPLRPDVGLAVYSAVSAGILAFVATRTSYNRLLMFLSASFAHATVMGQWSMLLTAALFAPTLAFFGAAKPNIAAAIVAALASGRAALAMLVVAMIALVIMPSWPAEWLEAVRGSTWHFSPLRTPAVLGLLAMLRWRRPEARLVAVLSVVPQSPFVYEAMPLFFVPRSRVEFYALVIGSDLALAVYALNRGLSQADYLRLNGLAVGTLMFVPAVVMVLRRPNEGRCPGWMERWAKRLPMWIRGRSDWDPEATPPVRGA